MDRRHGFLDGGRPGWRLVLSVAYFGVGLVHLSAPDAFLPIMPAWVPEPRLVVIATGVCELFGAVGLVTRRFRWWAGVMLALYAVCVYPANIKHAIDNVNIPSLPSSWWYHGPRLAFQPFFVWWALYAGGVIDWPFRRLSQGDRDIPTSSEPGRGA